MMNKYEQDKNDMTKKQTEKDTKFKRVDYLKNHPEDVIGAEVECPTTLDEGMEI